MIIEPAIDLKDQKCVRLKKGDFDTVHQVADDPIATARLFQAAGAKWLHMVDLDGARSGARVNAPIVASVAKATGLQIELGGGLRTMEDLRAADESGVTRLCIGSAAVSDPDFVRTAVKEYGQRIAVGVDALDGTVRVSGWEKDSGLDCITFAKEMERIGVETLVFTDISTDGMLTGPSLSWLEKLQSAVSCRIVASGGVSNIEDIRALKKLGVYAAIIGKAYYAGTIDLAEAIREAGEQC
jgi:phosphoribosylformimino-5-aminoimidazole carboxamide ribotide isomerase